MSPRLTRAMQKQAELAAEILGPLLQDEDVMTAFNPYAYMLLKRLDIQHPRRALVEEALGPGRVLGLKGVPVSEEELQLLLLDVIKARHPRWYHHTGTHIPYFHTLLVRHLLKEAPDAEARKKLADYLEEIKRPSYQLDHLPDNPITVEQDPVTGKVTLTDVEDAEPKHFMKIRAHLDSLRPARPVGRPRGGTKPKTSGRKTLDPTLALRVYQAKLDAPKWSLQQATRVLGERVPSDHKTRERLRARVNRLLALGARLHRKKSVR